MQPDADNATRCQQCNPLPTMQLATDNSTRRRQSNLPPTDGSRLLVFIQQDENQLNHSETTLL